MEIQDDTEMAADVTAGTGDATPNGRIISHRYASQEGSIVRYFKVKDWLACGPSRCLCYIYPPRPFQKYHATGMLSPGPLVALVQFYYMYFVGTCSSRLAGRFSIAFMVAW